MNSREYEWGDYTVVVAGRVVTGIRGLKYTSHQEKEALFAKGNKPHSIQHGNKTYDGTLILLQSELEAITKAAGGDLLDASFNVISEYGNPLKGDPISTDLLKGVEFTEVPKGLNQNDKFAEIELPIIIREIKHGAF